MARRLAVHTKFDFYPSSLMTRSSNATPTLPQYRALLLVICFALTACGGGDNASDTPGPSGDPNPLCTSFATSGGSVSTSVDPACTDCAVGNAPKAIDDDLKSGADVTAGNHPGSCTVPVALCDPPHGVTVRATAQPGVVFPSGQYPTAYFGGESGNWSQQLRTYLGGAQQEETSLHSDSNNSHSDALSFQATKPFDAVEVFIAFDDPGQAGTYHVFEICSDAPWFH